MTRELRLAGHGTSFGLWRGGLPCFLLAACAGAGAGAGGAPSSATPVTGTQETCFPRGRSVTDVSPRPIVSTRSAGAPFTANSEGPIRVYRYPRPDLTIGYVFSEVHGGATFAGAAYLMDPTGSFSEFRFAALLPAEGICNPADQYELVGPVDVQSVEPPERAAKLATLLASADRPTQAEYDLQVRGLLEPPRTLMVSAPPP